MTRAYIYMQLPGETELVTLGRLVVKGGMGGVCLQPRLCAAKGLGA